jgi:hypothetical protein
MEPSDPEKKMRKIKDLLIGLAINAAMIGVGYLGFLAFATVFPYNPLWVA